MSQPNCCLGAGHLEARYANYFQVGHNAFEFLIDFGQMVEGGTDAQVNLRVVTSPVYVKLLLRTLGNAVLAYEESFGAIPEPEDDGAQAH
jgi:hypothetical protein